MLPDNLFPDPTEDFPLFTTEERVLTYNTDFAVRLTEKEMNAYRVQVIVSPYYTPRESFRNLEFNPEKGFYARYTAWSQDVGVTHDGYIQYPGQVIMDYRNEGMLSRWWAAALFWISANLEGSRFAVLGDALSVIPGFALIWDLSVPRWSNDFNQYLIDTTIPSDTEPGDFPKLRIPGFAPPQTMWKFVSDIPGTWYQVIIKIWYLEDVPNLPIEQPTPEGEEPDNSPDSQPPKPTSDGEPPNPEDESPADPSIDPGDYATAPPFEPEEPEEPVLTFLSIVGDYGIEFPNGNRAPGPTGQQTFCTVLSQPPPTIQSSTNIDGIAGNGGWRYSYTDQSGTRITQTVGATGTGATPYGSPQVVLTPC